MCVCVLYFFVPSWLIGQEPAKYIPGTFEWVLILLLWNASLPPPMAPGQLNSVKLGPKRCCNTETFPAWVCLGSGMFQSVQRHVVELAKNGQILKKHGKNINEEMENGTKDSNVKKEE